MGVAFEQEHEEGRHYYQSVLYIDMLFVCFESLAVNRVFTIYCGSYLSYQRQHRKRENGNLCYGQ